VLILDTDAISLIQRGDGFRFETLIKILEDADDDVFVTVISFDEQIHGAFKEIANNDSKVLVRGYHRLYELLQDYGDRPMLQYDDKAGVVFQKLKVMKGRPATKDLRIASIALSHGATVVTGNLRDFQKVPVLKVIPIT
jgi:tRNA(fMet)-specific endonuclease VapC